jgi:hypothetical protein
VTLFSKFFDRTNKCGPVERSSSQMRFLARPTKDFMIIERPESGLPLATRFQQRVLLPPPGL